MFLAFFSVFTVFLIISVATAPLGSVRVPPQYVAWHDDPVTKAVRAVVAVDPWLIPPIFSGVYVTIPTVIMFSVAPACSFCVASKVIILSSNDSIIYCNLIRSISSACPGFGVERGGGWVWVFFLWAWYDLYLLPTRSSTPITNLSNQIVWVLHLVSTVFLLWCLMQ